MRPFRALGHHDFFTAVAESVKGDRAMWNARLGAVIGVTPHEPPRELHMRMDDVDAVVYRGIRLILDTMEAMGGHVKERDFKREMATRGHHYKVYARNKRRMVLLGLIQHTIDDADVFITLTPRGRDVRDAILAIMRILDGGAR